MRGNEGDKKSICVRFLPCAKHAGNIQSSQQFCEACNSTPVGEMGRLRFRKDK